MLRFTEEQNMLRTSAERFVKEHYEFDTRRKRAQQADVGKADGEQLWATMAELGWLMIPFDEADGGLGGGLAELVGVYEAFGRGLVLEPFFSVITLGGGFVARLADDSIRQAKLETIMAGQHRVAAALLEPRRRFDLLACDTTAERTANGFRLSGTKSMVLGGGDANDLVVLARTGGASGEAEGRTLFLVPASDARISRTPYPLRDDHAACDVKFDGVEVGAEAVIGDIDQATAVLDPVLSTARVCLSAEALGIMAAATAASQAYLGTRQQFGRPLGAFQVLSHRLTDMFVSTEEVRSLIHRSIVSEGTPELSRLSLQTKLRANTAGLDVTKEAIQMHGGIGVTEELVIGHYFRRMLSISMLFGDSHALRTELGAA